MRLVYGVAALAASALALTACGKKEAAKGPEAGGATVEKAPEGPVAITAPRRTPGLWKITTTAAGMTQTTRLCTDEATEAKFPVWGGQATKDMCSKQEMSRSPTGQINFSSTCNMGSGGVTTTTGTIKGDFAKSYMVTAKTETTGAGAPQMNGSRDMVMQADWEGPCPADFKPGDMELSGGYRFNIMDAPGMSAGGQ